VPELPEVETVRRSLAHLFTGYKFLSAQDLHPRVLKPDSIAQLSTVIGSRIKSINRRGKFLWFELDRDFSLVAHLGMTGKFLVSKKDRPTPGHIRAHFRLSRGFNKQELVFNDRRTFGWLSVEQLTNGIPQSALHIAVDPFDSLFDRTGVITRMKSRKAEIKSVILDQEIMSGVGNIYADESLWRAKIHPETPACDLSARRLGALVDAATMVMGEAIQFAGTSFDDLYFNPNDEIGYFKMPLAAYGRENQQCLRCSGEIRRIAFGGRSSHFCPTCQMKQ
jgi:formamidopyrimidine-DNA glycosylase